MGIFKKDQPNDVLFLMPVRYAGEKIPRGKIRMLYSDINGKLHATIISRSIYNRARENAGEMASNHRPFAVVGLETGSDSYLPVTVEIGPEEVWALEHTLDHAFKKGKLPDILKKYVTSIIKTGSTDREAAISSTKKTRRRSRTPSTPPVLNRLPYYREEDIEVSMPIYKAAYSYPLILLKRLPPDEQTPPNTQRLLVLDSDGDMVIIRVPTRLVRQIEMELIDQNRKSLHSMIVLITQQAEGFTVDYMPINVRQKKALKTLTHFFEETGSGKQPISSAAQSVITRAKDHISSP